MLTAEDGPEWSEKEKYWKALGPTAQEKSYGS